MINRLLITLILAALLVPSVYAQTGSITGKVVDAETGETIPGVNVQLAEIQAGAATNADGVYRIGNVQPGDYTLRATFVGYQAFETNVTIQANSQVTRNIKMESGSVGLDEVVVTGYGTQKATNVSGSISNIGSQNIEDIPAQNAESLIQGRAAGVQMSMTSGNPGGGFQVDIRGQGSINAGNRPLYIVDGVQMSFDQGSELNDRSPLNALDPSDIESIEVLKDAAAASIYGAQASNGVVLITTKSGREGDTRVTVNFEGGVRAPNANYNVLNRDEWIDLNIDALGEESFRNNILTTYGYDSDIPLEDVRGFNYYDFVTRRGTHMKAGFTANGGDETTQFYLSGNWSDTEGGLKEVAYQSYNFRSNLSQQFTSNLNVDVKLALSKQDMPGVCQDGYFVNCPWSAIQFEPPISYPYLDNGEYNPNTSFGLNNNLAVIFNEEERTSVSSQVLGNIKPTYNFTPWLSLSGSVGLDWQRIREVDYESPIAAPSSGGENDTRNNTITNLTANATLDASQTFNDVHSVNALIGTEYRREFEVEDEFGVQGFNNSLLKAPSAASRADFYQGFNTEFRLLSGFGSVDYNYDERYVVTFTGRYDGTSRFGADRRFGFFPSASAAWRLSEESFFTADFVDDLKLRVSYGVTGNSDIGNFASRGLYSVQGSYKGQVGFGPSQLANNRLTWEENREINLGVDYAFWDGRMTGSIEAYRSRTNELLLGRPLPRSSGFGGITENIGAMQNRGVEFQIETVNVQTEDLRWSTRFTIGVNQNTVKELSGDSEQLNSGSIQPVQVGQSLDAWKVPRWAGVNPADGRPMWYDENGEITYRPTEADRKFFDGGEEDAEGGFGTRLGYKGLSMDVFFQYSYGQTAIPYTERFFLAEQGSFSAGHQMLTERWREPGDVTKVPRAVPNGNYSAADDFSSASTFWLYDASYLRLKSARISYSLPSDLAETIRLSGARVYVSGNNLLTWTSFIGLDPEVAGSGTTSSYPSEKQFNVGLQLDL